MIHRFRFVLASVVTLVLGSQAHGQPLLPEQVFTVGTEVNESIKDVAMTQSGDVFAVGARDGLGHSDILILKYRRDGTLAFAKVYEFGVYSFGQSIEVMGDGGIVVSAYNETRFVDALTMRLDSLGNVIWANTWGSGAWDPGSGLTIDGSGNVYQNVASLGLGSHRRRPPGNLPSQN